MSLWGISLGATRQTMQGVKELIRRSVNECGNTIKPLPHSSTAPSLYLVNKFLQIAVVLKL